MTKKQRLFNVLKVLFGGSYCIVFLLALLSVFALIFGNEYGLAFPALIAVEGITYIITGRPAIINVMGMMLNIRW